MLCNKGRRYSGFPIFQGTEYTRRDGSIYHGRFGADDMCKALGIEGTKLPKTFEGEFEVQGHRVRVKNGNGGRIGKARVFVACPCCDHEYAFGGVNQHYQWCLGHEARG